MNSVTSISILLIFLNAISCSSANEKDLNYYAAYSEISKKYKTSLDKLNTDYEKCFLTESGITDYSKLAQLLPKGLSKSQITAAVYLKQKETQQQCIKVSFYAYITIASDMISVITTIEKDKIIEIGSDEIKRIREEIEYTLSLLKNRQTALFDLLATYQTLTESQKNKFDGIKELKSNFDIIKLVNRYLKDNPKFIS